MLSLQQTMLKECALVAVMVVVASVSAAINEIKPRQTKPGRFLSLPVPQKCSQSKYFTRVKN